MGVRYADDAVGTVCSSLHDLGVLEETAIWVGSDHGEALGELGVYADHQAADEVTAHIPAILSWPGVPAGTFGGLNYHLDVAATVADLAGAMLPATLGRRVPASANSRQAMGWPAATTSS